MPPNGSAMIEVGQVFGDLAVQTIRRGAKNVHVTAVCLCRCGEFRSVRLTALRRGKVICCATCARRGAWQKRSRNDTAERWLLEAESTYRSNAKRKNLQWGLTREQFRGLVKASCHYCGNLRSGGIDRLNGGGYTVENVVSCCAACNYAKGRLTETQFIELVEKIYRYLICLR